MIAPSGGARWDDVCHRLAAYGHTYLLSREDRTQGLTQRLLQPRYPDFTHVATLPRLWTHRENGGAADHPPGKASRRTFRKTDRYWRPRRPLLYGRSWRSPTARTRGAISASRVLGRPGNRT